MFQESKGTLKFAVYYPQELAPGILGGDVTFMSLRQRLKVPFSMMLKSNLPSTNLN